MLTPLLCFPGTCRDALTFYADVFQGGTSFVQTFAQAEPASMGAEGRRVFEAYFWAPGLHFRAADVPEGTPVGKAGPVVLQVSMPTSARRDAVLAALREGTAGVDASDGRVEDRFGVVWQIVCDAD